MTNSSEDFKSIDKLIILAQCKRYYKKKEDSLELVYISGGLMIDLKNNIQYKINHPEEKTQINIQQD